MRTYSIGEVEEIAGVKAHVLRYWEDVIPGFAPEKDIGGRRIYNQRELELVLRLKYRRHFYLKFAKRKLLYLSHVLDLLRTCIKNQLKVETFFPTFYFRRKNAGK